VALREALRALGLPFSPSTLGRYRRINDAIWAAYRRGEITQPALARERFRRLLGELGAPARLAGRLGALYLDRLSGRGDRRPGCRAALRALRRDYRLGVVTNGIDRVQRSRLRASGLAPFFEVVVTSQSCGYAKPDPRILLVALDALGLRPREALYVGDDLATDGGAAAAAGLPCCWMDPGPPQGGRRPRRRVGSLADLAASLRLDPARRRASRDRKGHRGL
jgi:2-haloacid dehalogenase